MKRALPLLALLLAASPALAERPADVLARLRGTPSTNAGALGSAFPRQYVDAYRCAPRPVIVSPWGVVMQPGCGQGPGCGHGGCGHGSGSGITVGVSVGGGPVTLGGTWTSASGVTGVGCPAAGWPTTTVTTTTVTTTTVTTSGGGVVIAPVPVRDPSPLAEPRREHVSRILAEAP